MADREARVADAIAETERLRHQVDALAANRATETARLSAQVLQGRQIAHAIKNELQTVNGAMSVILEEDQLTPHQKADIALAMLSLETVASLVDDLHRLVRTMDSKEAP